MVYLSMLITYCCSSYLVLAIPGDAIYFVLPAAPQRVVGYVRTEYRCIYAHHVLL